MTNQKDPNYTWAAFSCYSTVVNLIDPLLPIRLNADTVNNQIKCLSPNPDLQ